VSDHDDTLARMGVRDAPQDLAETRGYLPGRLAAVNREIGISENLLPETVSVVELRVALSLPAPELVLAQICLDTELETEGVSNQLGRAARASQRTAVEGDRVVSGLQQVAGHALCLLEPARREGAVDRAVPHALDVRGRLSVAHQGEDRSSLLHRRRIPLVEGPMEVVET
jgi:hypothetical protein